MERNYMVRVKKGSPIKDITILEECRWYEAELTTSPIGNEQCFNVYYNDSESVYARGCFFDIKKVTDNDNLHVLKDYEALRMFASDPLREDILTRLTKYE